MLFWHIYVHSWLLLCFCLFSITNTMNFNEYYNLPIVSQGMVQGTVRRPTIYVFTPIYSVMVCIFLFFYFMLSGLI